MHAWCPMPHSLYFDMQHDYFQKKMSRHFDSTPGAKCLCKDRTCACMVFYALFPLIWYATWLPSEKMSWPFDPTPGAEGAC